MWPGELLTLLLVLFGCADYIYFQQILTKQTRQFEPPAGSTSCQTAHCKAKRQIEEGVKGEAENVAVNNTSLNMEVMEQLSGDVAGNPDEEELSTRNQDLLDRIIQYTAQTRNVNHTLTNNTETNVTEEKLLSEASAKSNTYSTVSEGDMGKKTDQKEITEIVPSVKVEELVPSYTKTIAEGGKLLTLSNKTTGNNQTDDPTDRTKEGSNLSHTIDISSTDKEENRQQENSQPSSTENMVIFSKGKSETPTIISKTENITETKNIDSTSTEKLKPSFNYTAISMSKDAFNTTNIAREKTSEDPVMSLNKTSEVTTAAGKTNSKLPTVTTTKTFSTSSVTTAATKLNYTTNKQGATENTANVPNKTEQNNLFVKNEEVTSTFNPKQNSITNNVVNVSTHSVETHKTTVDNVSFNKTIFGASGVNLTENPNINVTENPTENFNKTSNENANRTPAETPNKNPTENAHRTPTETTDKNPSEKVNKTPNINFTENADKNTTANPTHKFKGDVSKTTSSSVTLTITSLNSTTGGNQSSITALGDASNNERDNKNTTRNETLWNSVSRDPTTNIQ